MGLTEKEEKEYEHLMFLKEARQKTFECRHYVKNLYNCIYKKGNLDFEKCNTEKLTLKNCVLTGLERLENKEKGKIAIEALEKGFDANYLNKEHMKKLLKTEKGEKCLKNYGLAVHCQIFDMYADPTHQVDCLKDLYKFKFCLQRENDASLKAMKKYKECYTSEFPVNGKILSSQLFLKKLKKCEKYLYD